MSRRFTAPLFACLDVTYKCNLNCIHCCFASISGISNENELSTKEIIDLLEQFNEMKIISLQFAGGEPFVRSDICELIAQTKKYNYVTSIATNGLFIDNDTAMFLKNSNIQHVQISLDGSNKNLHEFIRGTGTFDKTINALNNLVKNEIGVSIATVLHNKNLHDTDDIIKLCFDLNVRKIRFQLLLMQGNAAHNSGLLAIDHSQIKTVFDRILCNPLVKEQKVKVILPCFAQFINIENKLNDSVLSDIGCGAGTTNVNINPFGDVSACGILTDDIWSVGNIRNESLNAIWNDDARWSLWRNISNIKGKCNSCDLFMTCKGGCRANAVLYNNDFHAEDPLCWR